MSCSMKISDLRGPSVENGTIRVIDSVTIRVIDSVTIRVIDSVTKRVLPTHKVGRTSFSTSSLMQSSLHPDWTALIPTFYFHRDEKFSPVSVERVTKYSHLKKHWQGKVIIMPGMPNHQYLTVHMINTEHHTREQWAQLEHAWLEVFDSEQLQDPSFAEEAPVYSRIVRETPEQVELRCMLLFSGKQEKRCMMWSRPQWLDLRTFDLVLRCQHDQWRVSQLGWWDREKYLVKAFKELTTDPDTGRIMIHLTPREHRFRTSPPEDPMTYPKKWSPVPQLVDVDQSNSSSSWSKVSTFEKFHQ